MTKDMCGIDRYFALSGLNEYLGRTTNDNAICLTYVALSGLIKIKL